jgi:plastocyanin
MTTDEETPRQAIGPGDAHRAHPYRERYVIPFIFPLMIVIGVVFFVLNVSRIFLASKGTAALVIASTITALILFGAAALSSAEKMRTSSVGLILVGSLVVLSGGGWVVVGHAEEHKAAAIVLGPPIDSLEVTVPAGQLAFSADKKEVAAAPSGMSVIQVKYHDAGAGQHTLAFDDPTVVWTILAIGNAGQVDTESAGFPKPGTYTYFCTIPGHRAAGMQGTVTVTASVKPKKVPASGGATTTSGA